MTFKELKDITLPTTKKGKQEMDREQTLTEQSSVLTDEQVLEVVGTMKLKELKILCRDLGFDIPSSIKKDELKTACITYGFLLNNKDDIHNMIGKMEKKQLLNFIKLLRTVGIKIGL